MRSKANIKSHPLHPILVVFPIAFFIGALIFDVLASIYGNETFSATARYIQIAGIAGAVLAAAAGLIDYVYTVPPQSSAKKRATRHGLLNSLVLIIFVVSLILKGNADTNAVVIIALELIAVTLMLIAGWMGGTLVHRNQIGIDIRYADAGKWKELYAENIDGEVEVAEAEELKVNQMKLVHVKDKRIVLGKTEEGYVAFDDRCPHKGGSLAGGAMICGTVQCPWHGTQFDVKTGMVKAGPGKDAIKTYPVFERADKVYISFASL